MADCATAWGLRGMALRYFNAAGAAADGSIGEDHTPESHLIPRVLQVALGQHRGITVFGNDYDTADGTCVRDYIHVEDLASAHRLALEALAGGESSGGSGSAGSRSLVSMTSPPGYFAAYNLGTGKGASVQQVITAAREITGHAIPSEIGPRRPGDPPQLFADPQAAIRDLGWRPRYLDVREIVATAWKWHESHPKGFSTTER